MVCATLTLIVTLAILCIVSGLRIARFNSHTMARSILYSKQAESGLDAIGEDISILPPDAGIVKIVMKFGGSSLANAERITYVSK